MKKVLLALLTLSLVLFLAACGGGDDEGASDNGGSDSAEGDSSTVDLTATNWEFDQEEYTVPAGEVTLNLINKEGFHGVEVEGTDINIEDEGKASENLEAGEYTIRCSIPCGAGHEDMTATLIVE